MSRVQIDVKLEWNGPAVKQACWDAARKAMWLAGEEILKRANQRVPLDAGILQASGETHMEGMPTPPNGPLTGTRHDGKTVTVVRPALHDIPSGELDVAVFYNTPYATRLHEHPEYTFQGGREGKWLERTVNESGPEVLKWLEKELGKYLK